MVMAIRLLLVAAVFAYPVGYLAHKQVVPGVRFVGKRELMRLRWSGMAIVAGVYLYGSLTEPRWWTDGDGSVLVAAAVVNIAYLVFPALVRFVLPSGTEG